MGSEKDTWTATVEQNTTRRTWTTHVDIARDYAIRRSRERHRRQNHPVRQADISKRRQGYLTSFHSVSVHSSAAF